MTEVWFRFDERAKWILIERGSYNEITTKDKLAFIADIAMKTSASDIYVKVTR